MPADVAPIPVTLSSSSVFALPPQHVFGMAEDLGYDGVEIMVTQNSWTQDPRKLDQLSEKYSMPIHSIHAPTLLFTQQVWGSAWNKIARSADMARELGADIVVAHPPFRWQGRYAKGFKDGIRDIMDATGVMIAVENMYPWKVSGQEIKMYLPHWDPTPEDYDHITWDFSHAGISDADSLAVFKLLGSRLKHVHVTDGTTSAGDSHLIPGQGEQPVAECLQYLGATGWDGAACVEVSTRKVSYAGEREEMLAEALRFTRFHLAVGQTAQCQAQATGQCNGQHIASLHEQAQTQPMQIISNHQRKMPRGEDD
ncbi:sugar phosphate isomerase/epimerase family protein [Auritidibacter ignavus]|uniref:sugar phosphate isomerase/epimerase family protein n=1 Tax=Auritidibacter ignavus TaxID=678932 RepID=UPI003CC54F6E